MPIPNNIPILQEINHTIYNNLNAVPDPDDPYHAEFTGMLCQVCWENEPSSSDEWEGVAVYYCQECRCDEDAVNGVGFTLLQATIYGGNNALTALQNWYEEVYGGDNDEEILN